MGKFAIKKIEIPQTGKTLDLIEQWLIKLDSIEPQLANVPFPIRPGGK